MTRRDKLDMLLLLIVIAAGLVVMHYLGQAFFGMSAALIGVTGIAILPGGMKRDRMWFAVGAAMIWLVYGVIMLVSDPDRVPKWQWVAGMALVMFMWFAIAEEAHALRHAPRPPARPTI